MTRRPAVSPRLLAGALAVCALLLAGCGGQAAPAPGGKLLASASAAPPQQGTVDLRIYLRAGEGEQAHLQPVTRRTAITGQLPRQALELLIAGPLVEDVTDAAPLRAPLPQSTQVQAFAVEGDTAVVDLSAHAIDDAARVDPMPAHELLALAAVANTLTEFPEIDHVRLTVNGQAGRFWGGWDLPELLSRDERVIGAPRAGDVVPPLERFAQDPQRVGSAAAGPVAVRGVRALDRIGFLRVEIELGSADGDVPAAAVPTATARLEGDRLIVEIADVLSGPADLQPGTRLALQHVPFDAVEAEAGELPGPARFALVPGARPFWLHTLTSPTRVVLDVRK